MSSSFYSQIGIPSSNSTAIQSSVNQAATSETNAATSATNSASSASASAASATSANAADVSATQSKNAAEAAETNAATSAAQSATSSAAAVTAQTASETAKTASELAATNASTSETNAAASATSAASSLAAIGTSVTDAATSATAAASTLETFQNQYLGAAATAPTLDPDGSALDLGDLWFDTASDTLKVYASGGWVNAGSSVNGTSERQTYTATAGQTTFAVTYDAGFVDVWLNGVKLLVGTDFTATSGTNIVLASGAAVNDVVDIVAFGTFSLSTHYTKTDADARFEPIDSAYTKVEADARYIQSGGSGSYADSDVDTHLNQSTATTGQYLKWNGSDYAWDTVAAGYADSDVDAHLLTAGVTLDATNDRVGIGTSSPSSLLEVNGGDGYFYNTNSFGGIRVGFNGTGANYWDIQRENVSTGRLAFFSGTSERMALTPAGNLGIGVNDPDAVLDISGGTNKLGILRVTQRASGAAAYGLDVGLNPTTGDPVFSTIVNDTVTESFRIQRSSGNVGIGNVSPSSRLYLEDTHATTATNAATLIANTTLSINGNSGQGSDVLRMGPMCTSGAYFIDVSNSGGSAAYPLVLNPFSGGKVGIGTSAPDTPLHVEGASGSQFVVEATSGQFAQQDFKIAGAQKGAIWVDDGTDLMGYYAPSGWGKNFYTNGIERLRMKSDSTIRISDSMGSALTSTSSNILITEFGSAFGFNHVNFSCGAHTAAYNVLVFRNGNGIVGNIHTNGSGTAYVTSSDYRLKENVTDISDGITRVKQLKPSRFNFIADADTTVDGFLAHQAQTVVPEAVTGTKDAMMDEEYEVTAAKGDIVTPPTGETDEVIHSSNVEQPETLEEGQQWRKTSDAVMGTRSVPDMQGIDQAKLVPLLTAALQEAIAKIETLETRVTALEAN